MRFAKWNPDGTRLLYENGVGGITLVRVDTPDKLVPLDIRPGNRPNWKTNEVWVHTTNNGATFEFGNPTPIFPRELHELAAGGGVFGGVDGGELFVRYTDGREERIPNAGQPCFDRDGNLFYKDGERFFEPTVLGSLRAWKEGNAVVTSWGARYEGEGYPRLIWTPRFPVLMSMTNDGLRVRRVSMSLNEGWERVTGIDLNHEPDGVYRDGFIWIACRSGILEPISLDSERVKFDQPAPPPPPPPDDEKEPPVSIPNRFSVVQEEFNKQAPAPGNEASWGEFTRRVARRLHAEDPKWGLVTKQPGEGQHEGFAIDVIAYREPYRQVDILAGTRWPEATPAWQEIDPQHYRPLNVWAVPVMGGDQGDPGDENDQPQKPVPVDLKPVFDAIDSVADELTHALEIEREERRKVQSDLNRIIAAVDKLIQLLTQERSTSRSFGHSHRYQIIVPPKE
jgi:hypothetical protein